MPLHRKANTPPPKPGYEFKPGPETVNSYSRTLRRNVPYFYDAVKQYYLNKASNNPNLIHWRSHRPPHNFRLLLTPFFLN